MLEFCHQFGRDVSLVGPFDLQELELERTVLEGLPRV